jgi:NADH-quinone oxidoreductase subunit N
MDLQTSFTIAAPEALLVGAVLFGVLAGAIFGDRFSGWILRASVLALAAAAGVSLYQFGWGEQLAFGGGYGLGDAVRVIKAGVYALAALALGISLTYLKSERLLRYEYALLTLTAMVGAGIMLSARDLTVFYLGVELLSISSYVLAAFNRDSQRSSEAGLKYFMLGALASGLMLYGMSLIYGFAGSTDYAVISQAEVSVGLLFGMVLLICGLAFKASAAPFHMWTPDVYQGGPSSVVALFATAPKLAAVMVFAGLMMGPFANHHQYWGDVIAIIAAASMIVGALGALLQQNLKRLLAYSSIANVGFALIGLAAGTQQGYQATLIYMLIYSVTALGLFALVLAMRREDGMVEAVSELAGLARTRPVIGMAVSALVFSVAGMPPLFGFLGKLAVFQAGLEANLLWLVLVGVLAAVVSLGYYLRILKVMWFDPPGKDFIAPSFGVSLALTWTAVGAGIGLAVLAGPLTRFVEVLVP